MVTISNEHLQVKISTKGAEVQSIQDIKTQQEYIWKGDEKWWSGHSPILFPIVGGMWNGVCHIDGQEISIPKHGIVRRAEWTIVDVQPSQATLAINSTVGSFKTFPFAYHLEVSYSLNERKLTASFKVTNLSGCNLWFQLGGHPAISLPGWSERDTIDGYLKIEGQTQHVLRAGEQGCLEPEQYPVPLNEQGLIPICVDTFSNEALIFDEGQVKAATILDKNSQPVARVESSSPVWLFWQPQGVHTPFVCCEPWYGLCDHQDFDGPIEKRPYINCAHSNETWQGYYTVEVF